MGLGTKKIKRGGTANSKTRYDLRADVKVQARKARRADDRKETGR